MCCTDARPFSLCVLLGFIGSFLNFRLTCVLFLYRTLLWVWLRICLKLIVQGGADVNKTLTAYSQRLTASIASGEPLGVRARFDYF